MSAVIVHAVDAAINCATNVTLHRADVTVRQPFVLAVVLDDNLTRLNTVTTPTARSGSGLVRIWAKTGNNSIEFRTGPKIG